MALTRVKKVNATNLIGTVPNTRLTSSAVAGTGPYEFLTEKIWTSDGEHDGDTYARTFFTNIFDKTKYSGYKVFFHWFGHEANGALEMRMQTGTSASTSGQKSDSYYFGNIVYMDSSDTSYKNTRYESASSGVLWQSVWPEDRGGLTGEMNINMVSNSPTASKNNNHFRPYFYGTLVGYYLGDQYRRADFAFRYNVSQDDDHYTGFQLFSSASTSVSKGSHISVYGIRWSTT